MEIICAIEGCGKVFTQKCEGHFCVIVAEDGEDILDHVESGHNKWDINCENES